MLTKWRIKVSDRNLRFVRELTRRRCHTKQPPHGAYAIRHRPAWSTSPQSSTLLFDGKLSPHGAHAARNRPARSTPQSSTPFDGKLMFDGKLIPRERTLLVTILYSSCFKLKQNNISKYILKTGTSAAFIKARTFIAIRKSS